MTSPHHAKLLLVPEVRSGSATAEGAVRRYRLARMPQGVPRGPEARFEHLKRLYG